MAEFIRELDPYDHPIVMHNDHWAAKNLRAYFQGSRELPWYMLGLSNASGMFDISGTMWLVTILFV